MEPALTVPFVSIAVAMLLTFYTRIYGAATGRPPMWALASAAALIIAFCATIGTAEAFVSSTPSAVGRNSVRADTPADAGPAAITGTATLTLGPAARSGTLTVSIYASPRAGAPGRIQGSRRVRVARGSRSLSATAFCRPGREYATWYIVADATVRLRSGRTIPLHDVSNVGQLSHCRPLA